MLNKPETPKLYEPIEFVFTGLNEAAKTNLKNQRKENGKMQLEGESGESSSQIDLKWKETTKIGPGLNNCGNTCFLNSVLQSINYTAPLANILKEGQHSKTCLLKGPGKFCVICAYENLVKRYFGTQSRSIEPSDILKNIKMIGKKYRIGRQEDAHEFLRDLLDKFHDACMGNTQSKGFRLDQRSLISDIFAGKMRSSVLCKTCGYRSDIFEPFLDLPLVINQNDTLDKCLEGYFKAEHLKGNNKYRCDKCKSLTEATKQFSIVNPPNILTCVFKRFSAASFHISKINRHIKFTTELQMGKYIATEEKKGDVTYDLYAVIVHLGHHTSAGHYYCYVKNSNNMWYKMNDESVSGAKLENVLNEQAYILFYVKRGGPAAPVVKKQAKVTNEQDLKAKAEAALLANLPNGDIKPKKVVKNVSTEEKAQAKSEKQDKMEILPQQNGEQKKAVKTTNESANKVEKKGSSYLDALKELKQSEEFSPYLNGLAAKISDSAEKVKKPNEAKKAEAFLDNLFKGKKEGNQPKEAHGMHISGDQNGTDASKKPFRPILDAISQPNLIGSMPNGKDAANKKSKKPEQQPATVTWQNPQSLELTQNTSDNPSTQSESNNDASNKESAQRILHRRASFSKKSSYRIETKLSKLRRLSLFMEPLIVKKIKVAAAENNSRIKNQMEEEKPKVEAIKVPVKEVKTLQISKKSKPTNTGKLLTTDILSKTSNKYNELSAWDTEDTSFKTVREKIIEENKSLFETIKPEKDEYDKEYDKGKEKKVKKKKLMGPKINDFHRAAVQLLKKPHQ